MKKLFRGLLLSATILPASSFALLITLGEQDFTNGQVLTFTQFTSASVGEPAPFDTFYGSDPSGPNFSKSFTFNFAPGSLSSATLSFGLYDGDGNEIGTQLASFSL